ncbi:glutathione S-transferase N-terminal domain-containing protein [Alteromonas lipolytica]|uniref:Glutaredoxin n=1 Tax=Alteromonas lipolytica TaxID=1856405 RepID=A0A1E8FAZ6_9ALTE|nr:glutathione S-transferase N-terminal domain-containing protein [Alteromonas lipolytica]OFI32778.1 glutaredoxin [Alteromonas lipolytica]GGF73116.1 hypothetical protein GCM10011338_26630 [Alteromonas lipolytica]
MVLKIVRNALGLVIVSADVLTRWKKVKRTPDAQAKVDAKSNDMTLYHFFACPFCVKTRRAIHQLNLNITKKSAAQGSPYREELIAGGGKVQVPCLHIRHADGKDEWMYESKQIIEYLKTQVAGA